MFVSLELWSSSSSCSSITGDDRCMSPIFVWCGAEEKKPNINCDVNAGWEMTPVIGVEYWSMASGVRSTARNCHTREQQARWTWLVLQWAWPKTTTSLVSTSTNLKTVHLKPISHNYFGHKLALLPTTSRTQHLRWRIQKVWNRVQMQEVPSSILVDTKLWMFHWWHQLTKSLNTMTFT